MWVVTGKTTAGNEVQYKVPAGKDTDKAFVLALAFQQHGAANADDPLTAETEVKWTSDNIQDLPTPITLMNRSNYAVDIRVSKGVWHRHSQRAFRSLEAAGEVLESAASEFPTDKFRIVATHTVSQVVAVSKNALDNVGEEPDKPVEEKLPEDAPEAESDSKDAATAKPKRTPKAA